MLGVHTWIGKHALNWSLIVVLSEVAPMGIRHVGWTARCSSVPTATSGNVQTYVQNVACSSEGCYLGDQFEKLLAHMLYGLIRLQHAQAHYKQIAPIVRSTSLQTTDC